MDINKEFFPEKIFNIEFIELVKNRKSNDIKKLIEELYPVDIAHIIEELEEIDDKVYLITLPEDKDFIVEAFEELEFLNQEEIIKNIHDRKLVSLILNTMASDDRADFFASLSKDVAERLSEKLLPEEKKDLDELLQYEENTAGGIMTTEFVGLNKELTVEEAIAVLRNKYKNAETIYVEFVVDTQGSLLGILSLRDIIIAEPGTKLKDIMETNVIYVYTYVDQEEVANVFQKYNFSAVPVLDTNEKVVGIITFDDIMDVIEEEATEDMQKIGASFPLEESYFDTSVFDLVKKRLLWLCVLLLVGTVTSSIIRSYDNLLAILIPLSYFIPIITDTGGNTGTQSSTMIIRSLALGEVQLTDTFRVLRKELLIGFILGCFLAVLGFMQSLFISKIPEVSFTLGFALIFTTVSSACAGGVLPIMAKKLKLDPTVMSGPLISTIVDIGGLIIYFETAKIILKIF
ncbi:MAG: magnesium transporter [Candidatus Muirbacterium halophilum]|nr:magnesium transporter [Candidatus Muirbacterium halophilum]MCK9475353.1 magnesium transporter [Candidatus Muirbacterium halophilum]